MLASTPMRHIPDRVRVRKVLVSVSNKDHLPEFVRALAALPFPMTLFSTGGTYRELSQCLADGGPLSLQAIEEYTQYPEMPGGLVKTLHPRIHGGLLADLDVPSQVVHVREQGMETFDLVVVNLYPFERTVARADTTLEEARKQIDIGGPTMLRAGAKNFLRVGVVVDPVDYAQVVEELRDNDGTLGFETRWKLAQKAFRHVFDYDRAIADYLEGVSFAAVKEAYDVR